MSPEPVSLLVVGGGPAGLSAARAYRAAGGRGPVAIVADEGRMPYHRPPLTKELLRGSAAEGELALEEEGWLADHDVVLVSGRATTLDVDAHSVVLSGGRELAYRRCVLCPGAEPIRPPIPGVDDPAVVVVRSLDHHRELVARLGDGEPVVVVGAGFIGSEVAASLALRGHPVHLIARGRLPGVERLGDDAGQRIAGWLEELGVRLVTGAAAERIGRDRDRLEVVTPGETLSAALVVLATGVAPRLELALAAGVEVASGAIAVDAAMRTSAPDLLAAGDAAFACNVAAGRRLRVEHWGDALGQGEIAGATAAGERSSWDAVPGFWSTIGDETLKYVAWGDGFDASAFEADGDSFVVRYGAAGRLVGVLAHGDDAAYEHGRELIAAGAPGPVPA